MSVATAQVATSACLEAFGALRTHLQAAKPELAAQVSDADIEDEFGRFRLWAANIGALSRGHSSLDYRLRDAPVVLEGASKLLSELQKELYETCLVLSGARLPYEAQVSSRAGNDDDSETSSLLSSDSELSSDGSSDSGDEKVASTELSQRVSALSNINDNLYRLSRSIRAPASHSRSLKALSHRPRDPETGVDLLEQFAVVDLAFTKDLYSQLRQNAQGQNEKCPILDDADLVMIKRLARGVTRRRQQFLYWKKHREKLDFFAEKEISKIPKPAPTIQLQGDAGLHASLPHAPKAPTETSRPKTTLTETTATQFISPAPVHDGTQSVTSYATTARGLDGSRVEFPKLPKNIKEGKDFECPYCQMICPPHYQTARAWRTHLLRDLMPYMCTYKDCHQPDELFATKQEWLNHEQTHQKAWQCPEHASAHFLTQQDFRGHLQGEAHQSLQRMSLDDLVAICETVRTDPRTICPICFVEAGSSHGLETHLANHLERFAAFALPRDVDDDKPDVESHDGSNMSEHAIARSDQSEVSDVSYAFAGDDKRAEVKALMESISERLFKAVSHEANAIDRSAVPLSVYLDIFYNKMIKMTNLPTEILDKLNTDLQFKAVYKTIPKLILELENAPDSATDSELRERKTDLLFQIDRLDTIFQEYSGDYAIDSSHPRLGMDTVLSGQNTEDERKQNEGDGKLAASRDSSPDRAGPRISTMDLNRPLASDSDEEAASPVRDSSPDSIVNVESSLLSTMDLNRTQKSSPAEGAASPAVVNKTGPHDASSNGEDDKTTDPNDIVAMKRARNTLAARKSRQKKLERFDELEAEIAKIAAERDMWKAKTEKPPSKNMPSNSPPFLIENLTLLSTSAQQFQQLLQDSARDEKIAPDTMAVLNLIVPGICVAIASLIAMLGKSGPDFNVVQYIEATNLHCQRLFKDASTFLDKYKRSTRSGWGSQKRYRDDKDKLVAFAQRVEHMLNDIQERYAKGRASRSAAQQGRDQDQPILLPLIETTTLPADNVEAGASLGRDGSPDGVVNRTGPHAASNKLVDGKSTEELPSENMPTDSAPLITTLTSLLAEAHGIQQHLQDVTTKEKVSSDAIVELNEIFPSICIAITSLITMLEMIVMDSYIVPFIEITDANCQRLFKGVSTFLYTHKKSAQLGQGSQKHYQQDEEHLVAFARRINDGLRDIYKIYASGRTLRRPRADDERDQKELLLRLSADITTFPADNIKARGEVSGAGEHQQLQQTQQESHGDQSEARPRNARWAKIDRRLIDPEVGDDSIVVHWTKIDRRLVSPEALDRALESYLLEGDDFVIVQRALSEEEVNAYAAATTSIRDELHNPVAPLSASGQESNEGPLTLRPSQLDNNTENEADNARDWDDNVVLNPHTLPRGSMDTSHHTERGNDPASAAITTTADRESEDEEYFASRRRRKERHERHRRERLHRVDRDEGQSIRPSHQNVAGPTILRRQRSLDTFDRKAKVSQAGPLAVRRERGRGILDDPRILRRADRSRSLSSRSSSEVSQMSTTRTGKSHSPKRGKTRMPTRIVNKRAINELGYPFEEEDTTIIIQRALSRKHIDEVIQLSEKYKKETSTSPYPTRSTHPPETNYGVNKASLGDDDVVLPQIRDPTSEQPKNDDESDDGSVGRQQSKRTLEAGTDDFVITERIRKLQERNEATTQYILKAKAKAKGKSPESDFTFPNVRRSETHHAPRHIHRSTSPTPQGAIRRFDDSLVSPEASSQTSESFSSDSDEAYDVVKVEHTDESTAQYIQNAELKVKGKSPKTESPPPTVRLSETDYIPGRIRRNVSPASRETIHRYDENKPVEEAFETRSPVSSSASSARSNMAVDGRRRYPRNRPAHRKVSYYTLPPQTTHDGAGSDQIDPAPSSPQASPQQASGSDSLVSDSNDGAAGRRRYPRNRPPHRNINRPETDEGEREFNQAEVEKWTAAQVAEHLAAVGVEQAHCDEFRRQEISGESLLSMDPSTMFLKQFELGSVGRRLNTWKKIKALQDEIHGVMTPSGSQQVPSPQASPKQLATESAASSNEVGGSALDVDTPVGQTIRLPNLDGEFVMTERIRKILRAKENATTGQKYDNDGEEIEDNDKPVPLSRRLPNLFRNPSRISSRDRMPTTSQQPTHSAKKGDNSTKPASGMSPAPLQQPLTKSVTFNIDAETSDYYKSDMESYDAHDPNIRSRFLPRSSATTGIDPTTQQTTHPDEGPPQQPSTKSGSFGFDELGRATFTIDSPDLSSNTDTETDDGYAPNKRRQNVPTSSPLYPISQRRTRTDKGGKATIPASDSPPAPPHQPLATLSTWNDGEGFVDHTTEPLQPPLPPIPVPSSASHDEYGKTLRPPQPGDITPPPFENPDDIFAAFHAGGSSRSESPDPTATIDRERAARSRGDSSGKAEPISRRWSNIPSTSGGDGGNKAPADSRVTYVTTDGNRAYDNTVTGESSMELPVRESTSRIRLGDAVAAVSRQRTNIYQGESLLKPGPSWPPAPPQPLSVKPSAPDDNGGFNSAFLRPPLPKVQDPTNPYDNYSYSSMDDEDVLSNYGPPDEDAVSNYGPEDEEAPMPEKEKSRLKRLFSSRPWRTEKGRPEPKGKGKDGGDNGGASSRIFPS
ncbi:hypothetical protein V490_05038 [Pseudogymnoascus sp. VKM F-3557]|nr:hypothetical protein V490_05038 [Pseudogymnoascus sp. VKM F-3557]